MAMSNPFSALKSRYFIFGVFTASSLIVGTTYGLLSLAQVLPWPHADPIGTPLLFVVIFGILCGTLYAGCRRFNLRLRYLFGPPLVRLPWWYLLVLVVCVLLFSFSSFSLIFYPISLVAPQFVEAQLSEQLLQVETVLPTLYQALMVFVTVVFAPVAEEFIFRGILLQRWSFKWGLRTGIVLSSILFGALHVNNPVGLTMFGLIMALLYVRTRSLWTPILAHTLNNLLSVLPELLTSETDAPSLTLADFQSSWWVGLVFLGLSAPILIHFIRRNWPGMGAPLPYMVNASQDS
jgi:membrane protease YdiL (CAAX protease family)